MTSTTAAVPVDTATPRLQSATTIVAVVTLAIAAALWLSSLSSFEMDRVSDLGLISLSPAAMLIGIALIAVGFAVALRVPRAGHLVGVAAILLVVLTVHGLPSFVEEAPRGSVAYLHAGFTEHIRTTGGLLTDRDARFSWPVFFTLGALVTDVAGITSAVELQAWAAPVLNLLYLVPLAVIFSSLSTDRRLVLTALFIFAATHWVGQDYYSPQGFNYLIYLTVLAILLRWFRQRTLVRPIQGTLAWIDRRWPRLRTIETYEDGLEMGEPDAAMRWRHAALVMVVVLLLAVSVASHQLTPFAILAGVTALVLLRRIRLAGLPVLLAVLIGVWISYMTVPFLQGHISSLINDIGAVAGSATENVTRRLSGSPGHLLVVQARLVMTLTLWLVAFAGAIRRFRHGHLDVEAVVLGAVPFGLMALQAYGGEMLLRVYIFGLPFVAFLAAGLFFPVAERRYTLATMGTLAAVLAVFAVALMLTKHGNERADYVSAAELASVDWLYDTAPEGSTLIAVTDASPLQYRHYGDYAYLSLDQVFIDGTPAQVRAAIGDVDSCGYLLLSRTQQASSEMYAGIPPEAWSAARQRLIDSGLFVPIFENADAEVLAMASDRQSCGAS